MPRIEPYVDPYKNYRFLVEIRGILKAGFTECTGYGSEVEAIEYREGGEAATVRKVPGKTTYPNISLKWGKTDNRELYDWHLTAINGKIDRKDGSIILKDDLGEEKGRWNFFEAWPNKYEGPALNASGKEAAIETLTIVCERLEMAVPA
jgi:phage tail-like protein